MASTKYWLTIGVWWEWPHHMGHCLCLVPANWLHNIKSSLMTNPGFYVCIIEQMIHGLLRLGMGVGLFFIITGIGPPTTRPLNTLPSVIMNIDWSHTWLTKVIPTSAPATYYSDWDPGGHEGLCLRSMFFLIFMYRTALINFEMRLVHPTSVCSLIGQVDIEWLPFLYC